MVHYSCTAAIGRLFAGRLCRGGPSRGSQVEVESDLELDDSQHPRSSRTLIHLLDDDSLLIMFSFCRPVILDEIVAYNYQLLEGGEWSRERWWNGLIQVCRRWRYLVLGSAFHLRVSLVCGRGTPVADMLAHSPPVPLIIDHLDEPYDILTAADREGIIFALQHRDRVRRIRIRKSVSILEKLIIALDGEYPILEFLSIDDRRFIRPLINYTTNLNFPETFRAPHLRELVLDNFATPIESPIFTTMGNLVTLNLTSIPSSAYFHPNVLLQRLSLMPQLETLGVCYHCYNPSREVERQLLRTPIMTGVTLPNLQSLIFYGTSAYLEALLPWLTVPLLERLHIHFFSRMVYSIPHLRQFMSTAQNFRPKTVAITFDEDHLKVMAFPDHVGVTLYTLSIELGGKHLDWQVVSAAQVFLAIQTAFSTVERLTIRYKRHNISSEWNRQADRRYWREFLGSFDKVKTLRVEYGIVEQVSRALQPGEGDSSTELLPELQELVHSRRGALRAFDVFIDARRKAGRPLTVSQIQ